METAEQDKIEMEKHIIQKLDNLLRHINGVRENCLILGKKLIEKGEIDFGLQLIKNSQIHDLSKFTGIEWNYIVEPKCFDDKDVLKLAISQHNSCNPHHPENCPGGIKDMPQIYLAEFCCDIATRAGEFGTGVREWFDKEGLKKYKITKNTKVYKEVKRYFDMILDKPFN